MNTEIAAALLSIMKGFKCLVIIASDKACNIFLMNLKIIEALRVK